MKTQSIIAAFLLTLLLSCSSSRIINSWKSDNIPVKKYNKIMVVGLMNNNSRDLRQEMENHLVSDLTEHGYIAISSLKEYGPKSFENMKENEVIEKLHTNDIDAVITIVLLDKQKEKYYVPGRIYYSPYSIYHRHFWGYYSTIYDRIYTPGYYTEDTKYFWESNFYDLENKELLYSIQTRSFNPNSVEDLAHEYGKLIVRNMAENGIINK